MENKFCFLKGIVDCESGIIQDCNNRKVKKCPKNAESKKKSSAVKSFCFLKGVVDCSNGQIQECNNQRMRTCPKGK